MEKDLQVLCTIQLIVDSETVKSISSIDFS